MSINTIAVKLMVCSLPKRVAGTLNLERCSERQSEVESVQHRRI